MNQPNIAYRPIFLQNLCASWFYSRDVEGKLETLLAFAPTALKWLDRTNVKGDGNNERSARVLLALLRRFAHWEHLQGDLGALKDLVQLHKRLQGLMR
jgi:hypothetical protein